MFTEKSFRGMLVKPKARPHEMTSVRARSTPRTSGSGYTISELDLNATSSPSRTRLVGHPPYMAAATAVARPTRLCQLSTGHEGVSYFPIPYPLSPVTLTPPVCRFLAP